MGCAVEEVLEAQEAATSYTAASLDAPVIGDEGAAGMVELLGADDASYALAEHRDAIARSMRSLSDVEREYCFGVRSPT